MKRDASLAQSALGALGGGTSDDQDASTVSHDAAAVTLGAFLPSLAAAHMIYPICRLAIIQPRLLHDKGPLLLYLARGAKDLLTLAAHLVRADALSGSNARTGYTFAQAAESGDGASARWTYGRLVHTMGQPWAWGDDMAPPERVRAVFAAVLRIGDWRLAYEEVVRAMKDAGPSPASLAAFCDADARAMLRMCPQLHPCHWLCVDGGEGVARFVDGLHAVGDYRAHAVLSVRDPECVEKLALLMAHAPAAQGGGSVPLAPAAAGSAWSEHQPAGWHASTPLNGLPAQPGTRICGGAGASAAGAASVATDAFRASSAPTPALSPAVARGTVQSWVLFGAQCGQRAEEACRAVLRSLERRGQVGVAAGDVVFAAACVAPAGVATRVLAGPLLLQPAADPSKAPLLAVGRVEVPEALPATALPGAAAELEALAMSFGTCTPRPVLNAVLARAVALAAGMGVDVGRMAAAAGAVAAIVESVGPREAALLRVAVAVRGDGRGAAADQAAAEMAAAAVFAAESAGMTRDGVPGRTKHTGYGCEEEEEEEASEEKDDDDAGDSAALEELEATVEGLLEWFDSQVAVVAPGIAEDDAAGGEEAAAELALRQGDASEYARLLQRRQLAQMQEELDEAHRMGRPSS